MIPKIEDGNDFGVSVQKEIINDIASIENESAGLYLKISKYHKKRANIISKVRYANSELQFLS